MKRKGNFYYQRIDFYSKILAVVLVVSLIIRLIIWLLSLFGITEG